MKCCSTHSSSHSSTHSSTHNGSDSFAWQDSFLCRIDPRVKAGGVAALLVLNLLAPTFLVPLVISLVMVLLMICGRVPYRRQLLMIAFPAGFAIFAVLSQTVFQGSDTFASIGPVDLHRDGLLHGLFLSLRVVSGGLVIVMLGVSTPLNRLCLALKWYRMPDTFLEVLQLTYRYLHDINAELNRMREAQRARLGWSSARAGLASSKMLGGSLFLRVYERGLRSAEAMRCRGSGPIMSGALGRPGRLDLWAGLTAVALVAGLALLSITGAGR